MPVCGGVRALLAEIIARLRPEASIILYGNQARYVLKIAKFKSVKRALFFSKARAIKPYNVISRALGAASVFYASNVKLKEGAQKKTVGERIPSVPGLPRPSANGTVDVIKGCELN